jgi:KDO2-lipid IV(A) lauroyltransferase
MAKPRSPTADYAAYLLVRLLVCVLQSLPLEIGQAFARGLAWLAYQLDRRHREVALDNLRRAFPGQYTEAQLQQLVRTVYQHFCHVLIEIIHLPRKLHPNNWRRYIQLSNGRAIVESLLAGRPLLIVTGHYGNWEMAGYALAMLGFKTYAVARPLDNPYLDRFLRQFRERTGQRLLAKKGELDRLESILQAGGVVCTLADQDAGQRGLFVDFFGRPASTHKAIALLALEHRVTLAVAGARKVGEPMQYVIHTTDVIPAEDSGAASVTVRTLTQRFTTALERLIRLDPRQYFWLHRRWKHQPGKRGREAA